METLELVELAARRASSRYWERRRVSPAEPALSAMLMLAEELNKIIAERKKGV